MTKDKILKMVARQGSIKSRDIVQALGISRQVAASHLKQLVESGRLAKKGSTNSATYYPLKTKGTSQVPRLLLIKKTAGLREDLVFDEVEKRLALKKHLNKNTQEIARYTFTEILNNAIEHSRSKQVQIVVDLSMGEFKFDIRDMGIGAFYNVRKGFKLEDEYAAAEHLFKGKQTTDPKNHSGQGVFFTSRIADTFYIRSHKLKAVIDNALDDVFFSDEKNIAGTEVFFSIKQKSKKTLEKLFRDFANEEYEFDKNEVRLRLRKDTEVISRSQARRLLVGLDKFQRITFDFSGIKGVGQGFASEIFRVFANKNPKTQVTYKNASPAVEFMILRAIRED